jgi:hypothetical protein
MTKQPLEILPYPPIPHLKDTRELHGQFVYLVEAYPESGLAVVFQKEGDQVSVRMGDFTGKVIDPKKPGPNKKIVQEFVTGIMNNLTATLMIVGVDQAVMYFSDDKDGLRLVDFRLSINKFTGPGFVKDIFCKQMRVHEIVEIVQLDDELLQKILDGSGKYSGEYVVKPSRFKFMERGDQVIPMYAKVLR